MAATRRKRQSHAVRVANYLAKHPGATRQAARGHGAHLRPPGESEYQERRRKRAVKAGGTGGLTPTERAAIRAAYVARDREFAARAREYGYDFASDPLRAIRWANEDIERPGGWGSMTYQQFLAVWGTMLDNNTSALFFDHGRNDAQDPVGAVQENFVEAMNAEHGLHLSDDMQWLKLLLYGPRKRKAA